MTSHSSTSSGPFTAQVSNVPLRFASPRPRCFTGSPAHVSALSGPAARAGIRPVPRDGRLGAAAFLPRVPSPFGHRHPLVGHPVPPRDSAPLTIGLPGLMDPDPDGVSTFRACETRPGWAPPIPRGQRCSRNRRWVSGRRLPPPPAARPYHPDLRPVAPGSRSRGINRGSLTFTRPAFPSPGRSPGRNGGPWACPSSFAPPTGRTRRAHVEAGTDLEH